MFKSVITNSTYSAILIAYVILSTVFELMAIAKGGTPDLLDLLVLTASMVLLVLLYLRHQYLRWAALAVATLAITNFMLYLTTIELGELIILGGVLFLLLLGALTGASMFLLIGSIIYIKVVPRQEIDEQLPDGNRNRYQILLNKKTFNAGLIPISLVLTFQSAGHYSDGGCDGGLCGLYFFMHGLPLLVAWAFTIIAVNKALGHKGSYFVFLIIAFLVNLTIILPDYGYGMKELKYPGYAILFTLMCSLWLYLYMGNLADSSEGDHENNNSM